MYASAWRKHLRQEPLTALEDQIVALVALHPEYHAQLTGDDALERDYTPAQGETNPFLHMSLHLAVRDQVATDRPAGVRALFDTLCRATGDAHAAEHVMLERLAEALWSAQRSGTAPDEQAYFRALQADARRLR